MSLLEVGGILAALAMGAAVLRTNPTRGINRAFFILSAAAAAWLLTLGRINPTKPDILFWIRLTNAEAALMPWLFWMLKATVNGAPFGSVLLRRSWRWGLVAAALDALCFTNFFIPAESTPEHVLVGPGRALFNVVIAVEYLWLLVQTVREVRAVTGIRRVELQFLMINGAAAGLGAIILNTLSVWLGRPELRRGEPMLVLVFYGVTAWAITSRKIFDAKQLFRSFVRRAQVVVAVAVVLSAAVFSERFVSRTVVVVVAAIVVVLLIEALIHWDLMGGGLLDQNSEATRRRLVAAARATKDWTRLEEEYCEILKQWGHSESVFIHVNLDGVASSQSLPAPLCALVERELAKQGWMTPEQLERQLPEGESSELGDYMRTHKLGALVAGPQGAEMLPVVLALGARYDRRPFTYVDIQFLRDCATVIEATLSRVLLTQQARDAEQLATAGLLGMSLAHEIRNPLVTIKSVVQLARTRYEEREFQHLLMNVMPGEIARIEVLVGGLMELGKPRTMEYESVHLNEIVEASLLLVRPRAKERDVALTTQYDAEPDLVQADKSSLRQVVLNLVMNAIDALANVSGYRHVTVRTARTPRELILEIRDNGPGVPPEVQRTLFRPFTRSAKTSGMGLGLAICADIVHSHNGEIKLVDDQAPGALFRVTLPCQQP